MIRYLRTTQAPQPFSRYSQAVEVAPGGRLVFVSGQTGVRHDGTRPEAEEDEHQQAWDNVLAILKAQGLGPGDIADVTAYVTSPQAVAIYRQVRDRMLAGAEPASTLLIVAGLADPSWRVELQVVAAAAPD